MSVLDFLDDELAALAGRDRLRSPRVVRGAQGTRIHLDGREVVSFSSNDYLGLAAHPALRAAAMAEIDRSGVGAGASRLIVGNQEAHVELEAALAELFRCEAALLFSSGYAANTGVLSVLGEGPDAIFSDALNHASIIDGCRLSRAKVEVYAHRDLGMLDEQLTRSPARRKIVVSESVFSMDGDIADLRGLRELADRHGAILVVDEAHAVGTLGPRGGGVLEILDLRADVVVGTLGKALGAGGACVAGSKSLTHLLWNRARPLVFSTSMPAMVAAAARAAVELVRGPIGAERRLKLSRNASLVTASLVPRGTGLAVPRGTTTGSSPVPFPRGTGDRPDERAGRADWLVVPRGTGDLVPGGSGDIQIVPGAAGDTHVPRETGDAQLVPGAAGGTHVRRGTRDAQLVPRGTGDGAPRRSGASARLVPRGTGDAQLVPRGTGATPIIPLVVGDDREVMRWTEYLLERGLFVQGIRPPTVPEGTARLRVAVSAGHEEQDLAKLAEAIASGVRDGLQLRGDG